MRELALARRKRLDHLERLRRAVRATMQSLDPAGPEYADAKARLKKLGDAIDQVNRQTKLNRQIVRRVRDEVLSALHNSLPPSR